MRYLVLDLETPFDWSRIDMCGFALVERAEVRKTGIFFDQASFKEYMLPLLQDKEPITLITWNGTRFDFNLLEKYWGVKFYNKVISHIDGMILHKLLYQTAPYGHSLEATAKDTFPTKPEKWKKEIDFGEATHAETVAYCIHDCKVTWWVVKAMLMSGQWRNNRDHLKEALKLETDVAMYLQKQVNKEVSFDIPLAELTHERIVRDMELLELEAYIKLPTINLKPSCIIHPPKRQFKADGELTVHMTNYLKKHGVIHVDMIHRTFKYNKVIHPLPLLEPLATKKKLTLGMTADLKEWLLKKGWEPTQYNFKYVKGKKVNTSPMLTDKITKEPCPNLKFVGVSFIHLVAKWLMLRSRKNILLSDKGTGWIPRARASKYSTLPSDADSMGANTFRWTHKGIANVPRPSSPYGKEFRKLFKARDNMLWVGWDASALEARVEAHYTHKYDGGKYAKELLEGDVHVKNRDALGLANRDTAKTFKYAITYGAQAGTLRRTLKSTEAEAQKVYDTFWEANPALAALRDDLEDQWELNGKKFIMGLDGRRIYTRSKHSLVNALFQSCGAIIMKRAMVIAEETASLMFTKEEREEIYGLIRYHDEEVWECNEENARIMSVIGEDSVVKAGVELGIRVPLAAESKIGKNWYDVH